MSLAIFGISNSGLDLVASLFVLMLVAIWLALIVYTYLDARRRISDPFLVGCATIASFFPYLGTAIYAIVRPPEYLEDAHERELEIRAAELRVRQLTELTCPNCEYPVEKNYLRCPNCQRRLKDPCPTCGKPVDPRWALCPYCERPSPSGATARPRRRATQRRGPAARPALGAPARGRAGRAAARAAESAARKPQSPLPKRAGHERHRKEAPAPNTEKERQP